MHMSSWKLNNIYIYTHMLYDYKKYEMFSIKDIGLGGLWVQWSHVLPNLNM